MAKKNLGPGKKRRAGEHRQSGAKARVLSSFAFVLFLMLSSFLLVFLVLRDNRGFEAMLQEVDQIQRLGVAPLKLYQSTVEKAQDEQDYLRVLKRVYQVQDRELRTKYSLVVTENAVENLPESENLWAYRVSALLDDKQFSEAVSFSENLESGRYLPLKGEVLVRSISSAQTTLSGSENLSIADVVRSSPYSAAIYINLARLFEEPRFAWDAALIYMLNGEKDKAWALVRELQGEPWVNPLGAGLIAYDNQDWALAASLLERQIREKGTAEAKVLQYLGDTYAFAGDYKKAIEVLRKAGGLTDKSVALLKENFVPDERIKKPAEPL
ncbi:MAG: tetratricopeptide repeat protein, partial [Spirochaetota bacterium]